MQAILRSAGLVAVILLAMSLAPANGGPCIGECSVYCDSGALYYFTDSITQCCQRTHVLYGCPDGSSAYWASWQPETCGSPQTCP